MKRGVDFGIAEFRRFLLLKTTSENTFESQLGTTIEVVSEENAVHSRAVRTALALRDRLPRDVKKGKRWVYRGLQGPVDRALVELAEAGNRDELRGRARAGAHRRAFWRVASRGPQQAISQRKCPL